MKVVGQAEEISYADLARREQPQSALGLPVPNPPHLPLAQLNEEAFERVVAEVVAQRATYDVLFYGRRGQTQYGLDIVAYTHDRGTVPCGPRRTPITAWSSPARTATSCCPTT